MLVLKRHSLRFVLFLSALILFSCEDNALPSPEPVAPPPDENPSVKKIPNGVWEQIGFGRAIDVAGETVDIYDYTRETCLIVGNTTQEEFANTLTINTVDSEKFTASEDGVLFVYSIRDAVPEACLDDRLITENGPVSTFEHTIHNFNDYYPFFEVRGIQDWDERVEFARSQVNSETTDEELLNTLIALLSDLGDGHVSLYADDDFEFFPINQDGKIEDVLVSGFQNQSEFTDLVEYVNAQFQRILAIRNSYFDPGSFEMAGGENQGVFQWATIGNGVAGYIEINSMGGITESSAENDLAASEDLMDRILNDLTNTEALIINVSVNGGGDLAITDAIASRFTTEKVIVSSYEAFSYDDSQTRQSGPRVDRELAPTGRVSYDRPIATISGPNTFSAAEHFLLSMRALNRPVCLIGEPSDGILSAPLDKQLPTEGARLGLSNMIIYDHTGQAFEAIGVPVDIETTTFEVVDSNSQRNDAIDTALTALGFGYLVNSDIPVADCALVDARTRFETSAP
jgi:C-terminal processing protease CtpA/Prc